MQNLSSCKIRNNWLFELNCNDLESILDELVSQVVALIINPQKHANAFDYIYWIVGVHISFEHRTFIHNFTFLMQTSHGDSVIFVCLNKKFNFFTKANFDTVTPMSSTFIKSYLYTWILKNKKKMKEINLLFRRIRKDLF